MMFDFDMGRYAGFVWPAYAVTALFLIAMTLDSLARARRWRQEAERLGGKDGGPDEGSR